MNAITCADLSFSYGKVRVIDDVSFEVQKGESIGVIGPNGGGKSTLLKLILGTKKVRTCRLMASNAGMKATFDMMVGLKYAAVQRRTGMKKFFTLTVRLLLAHH